MLLDYEGEFGAAQNDALCPALSELFHLLEHILLALALKMPLLNFCSIIRLSSCRAGAELGTMVSIP